MTHRIIYIYKLLKIAKQQFEVEQDDIDKTLAAIVWEIQQWILYKILAGISRSIQASR